MLNSITTGISRCPCSCKCTTTFDHTTSLTIISDGNSRITVIRRSWCSNTWYCTTINRCTSRRIRKHRCRKILDSDGLYMLNSITTGISRCPCSCKCTTTFDHTTSLTIISDGNSRITVIRRSWCSNTWYCTTINRCTSRIIRKHRCRKILDSYRLYMLNSITTGISRCPCSCKCTTTFDHTTSLTIISDGNSSITVIRRSWCSNTWYCTTINRCTSRRIRKHRCSKILDSDGLYMLNSITTGISRCPCSCKCTTTFDHTTSLTIISDGNSSITVIRRSWCSNTWYCTTINRCTSRRIRKHRCRKIVSSAGMYILKSITTGITCYTCSCKCTTTFDHTTSLTIISDGNSRITVIRRSWCSNTWYCTTINRCTSRRIRKHRCRKILDSDGLYMLNSITTGISRCPCSCKCTTTFDHTTSLTIISDGNSRITVIRRSWCSNTWYCTTINRCTSRRIRKHRCRKIVSSAGMYILKSITTGITCYTCSCKCTTTFDHTTSLTIISDGNSRITVIRRSWCSNTWYCTTINRCTSRRIRKHRCRKILDSDGLYMLNSITTGISRCPCSCKCTTTFDHTTSLTIISDGNSRITVIRRSWCSNTWYCTTINRCTSRRIRKHRCRKIVSSAGMYILKSITTGITCYTCSCKCTTTFDHTTSLTIISDGNSRITVIRRSWCSNTWYCTTINRCTSRRIRKHRCRKILDSDGLYMLNSITTGISRCPCSCKCTTTFDHTTSLTIISDGNSRITVIRRSWCSNTWYCTTINRCTSRRIRKHRCRKILDSDGLYMLNSITTGISRCPCSCKCTTTFDHTTSLTIISDGNSRITVIRRSWCSNTWYCTTINRCTSRIIRKHRCRKILDSYRLYMLNSITTGISRCPCSCKCTTTFDHTTSLTIISDGNSRITVIRRSWCSNTWYCTTINRCTSRRIRKHRCSKILDSDGLYMLNSITTGISRCPCSCKCTTTFHDTTSLTIISDGNSRITVIRRSWCSNTWYCTTINRCTSRRIRKHRCSKILDSDGLYMLNSITTGISRCPCSCKCTTTFDHTTSLTIISDGNSRITVIRRSWCSNTWYCTTINRCTSRRIRKHRCSKILESDGLYMLNSITTGISRCACSCKCTTNFHVTYSHSIIRDLNSITTVITRNRCSNTWYCTTINRCTSRRI